MRAMKLFGALAALLLVVACESTPEDMGGASGAGAALQPTTEIIVDETVTYVPGSQEELTALYGDRVFFGTDQSDLQADARATLEGWSQWLRQYPSATLTVEGHCDERGTSEYNLALGDRRSTAARDYLLNQGVPAGKLTTISYGEERPQCTSADESCWQSNRRAHFAPAR